MGRDKKSKGCIFALHREVSEWLKEHAWKACKRQKRFEGSNPFFSTTKLKAPRSGAFLFIGQAKPRLSEGLKIKKPQLRSSWAFN